MAKRTDRRKAFRHHQEQLETLKTLDPIATPDRWKPFSDALVDIAIAALDVAYRIEAGRKPTQGQVVALFRQVNSLLAHAPEKEDGHEPDPVDSTAWQTGTHIPHPF
jgi:hypothetical protein